MVEVNWDKSEALLFQAQLMRILDAADVELSEILPSDWAEQNRMMTIDVSPIEGMFSYDNSPYIKPIADCFSPNHPARIIAFMKAAQIGASVGIVENVIGWIMSQQPGNILYLVGHDGLIKPAVKKLDTMIEGAGIGNLIHSTSKRIGNKKSGNTDRMKEFPSGMLMLGTANHGILRQISMQYGFIDDFDKMKTADKSSGSTTDMIEQRFAAYFKKMKLAYLSSPELKSTSNIEPVYLKGDQRKWHVPCPCCGEYITLEWQIESKYDSSEMAGITWKLDDHGKLIVESVGYTCQECDGFFDDRNKMDMIRAGYYIPTAEPSEPGYYSFHVNALYTATYMYDWVYYVRKWLAANPPDGSRDIAKHQAFVNLVLGETYEPAVETVSANELQKNTREYEIGKLPEKLSIIDGNGKIIMLTLGSDLNGTTDDARLDWEIVAHSETGATYSIDQGSIGTFIPLDKHPENREHFTYRRGASNSVWPILQEIMSANYEKDSGGNPLSLFLSTIDAGHLGHYVYEFVENCNGNAVAVRGYDDLRGINSDTKTYKKSKEHPHLYLIATNYTKDRLANNMGLKWDPDFNDMQPFGFMNFPTPSDDKYSFKDFYSHYESEHKHLDKKGKFRWEKKSKNHQNHFFDVRLYALVARDIFLDNLFKTYGIKNGTWRDYVDATKKHS